jgi:hypothetical protein
VQQLAKYVPYRVIDEIIEWLLSQNPDKPILLKVAAESYLIHQDGRKAVECARRWIAIEPGSSSARELLAQAQAVLRSE